MGSACLGPSARVCTKHVGLNLLIPQLLLFLTIVVELSGRDRVLDRPVIQVLSEARLLDDLRRRVLGRYGLGLGLRIDLWFRSLGIDLLLGNFNWLFGFRIKEAKLDLRA